MTRPASTQARFFRWHRWLAYLVALQVALWVLGGIVFAWLPFQPWVKGADAVARPQAALSPGWAAALAQAALPAAPVEAVTSVAAAGGPAWRLRLAGGGEAWLDAQGRALAPPGADDVRRFAQGLYRGSGRLVAVERLDAVAPRLAIVQETASRPGLWRAQFDDLLRTRLYIDARSGELLAVRNEAWVVYDFLFRLHVMDYAGGEDFNNPLLRGAALAAGALVVTGGVLLALALRRAWQARHRTRMGARG